MAITSFDDFITMAANGDHAQDGFYAQIGAATSNSVFNTTNLTRQLYFTKTLALPSLPVGKNYFFPTSLELSCSAARSVTVCKLVSFGTLDISGASGTFTNGSVAPTRTEGGVSRQIPSAVLAVVTTSLNATPGNFTITYIDQDNNVAETTGSAVLAASAVRGTAGFITLNGTDWGALDITGATRGGGTTPTGVLEFFHVEPLGNVIVPVAGFIGSINFLTDLVHIHKLSAGDQLMFLGMGTTTNAIMGRVNYGVL